jgi:hypothetical protein
MYQEEVKTKENKICVKCSICNNEIIGRHRFVRLAVNYGVICQECSDRFNNSEIELVSNLFTAFGGYFGSRKGEGKDSGYQTIKRLSKFYRPTEKKINLNALDVKILHQALLYGIAPNQIVKGLELLVDE